MTKPTNREPMTYDEIVEDEIVLEWATMCLMEHPEDGRDWMTKKSNYWAEHEDYLKEKGFEFHGDIHKALDDLTIEKLEDLEGSLIIVTVGTEQSPATDEDIDYVYETMKAAFASVKNVRVIVLNKTVDIKKISLPQLRRIESEIVSNRDEEARVSVTNGLEL